MQITTFGNADTMGVAAGEHAAAILRRLLDHQTDIRMIVATGASQFGVLQTLTNAPDIDWSRVTGFHLDEYVGISADHPASFRRYLRERFTSRVTLAAFHELDADRKPTAECERVGGLLTAAPIDLCLCGIGENGHLAFNDPPADFETESPYLVVDLDEDCRRQQVGEGWFATIADVPRKAISMSIRQIMKSQAILCSVPDTRKANAVAATVEGEVTPAVPASILQTHPETTLYLDAAAASKLRGDR